MSFRQKKEDKSAEGVSIRYYISSKDMDAKEFAHAIRAHWLIEHSLHWVLDVKMNEDASRIRRGNAGNDSNLLIVFYVQIMPDDFVMQLHRF